MTESVTAPFAGPRYNVSVNNVGTGPDVGVAPSRFLSDDELDILNQLRAQIRDHQAENESKQAYYEARQVIRHLDISVPRTLQDIGTAVGWAGTVVDALDERVDFLGWQTDDNQLNGLGEIFADNNLDVESNYAHVDALTTGVSFVSVGNDTDTLRGASDSTRQLIIVESSSNASVIWDYRHRRSIAGLSQSLDSRGNIVMESLYLEDANVVFERDEDSREMVVTSRDQHNLGRCFMTRMVNRPRPYQLDGRSEISRAVRYYTDAAVRTMLGMEVNREFYTAPQRFILNANPQDFGVTDDMTQEQKFRRGLSVAMGMVNIIPPRLDNTEGDPPSVQEMRPAPPTPYIEQVKAYSIQMSAETGFPATLFGFVTDNPTSADAIVKGEFRLAKRAARRIASFGLGWKETGILALLARDGTVDPDFVRKLLARYDSPMIPTPSAKADEISKMIAAQVLVPDSAVTYEQYGLSEQDQKRLTLDKKAAAAAAAKVAAKAAAAAAQALQTTGAGVANPPATSPPNTGM